MKNVSTHCGTLEMVERMPNSKNGNPRYKMRVSGVSFVSQVDSSHGYSLPNDWGKTVQVWVGTHYGKATLDSYKILS